MSTDAPTDSPNDATSARVPTGAEARTRFDRSAGDSSPDSDSDSLEDALARARGHAQAAVAEALAAISALLDAASLASSGELARSNGILAPATRILEGLRSQLGGGQDHESLHLIQSIAEALDAEIARWEDRARDDADARAVLRAFLGLRELLWEFGVRTGEKSATRGPSRPKKARAKSSTQRKNVQRVTVEG